MPDVLLPRSDIDLHRWCVVACDQFTSQPDYWRDVEQIVGDAPSALRLVFPEVHLDAPDAGERVAAVRTAMGDYAGSGILERHEQTMVLVRRSDSRGLVRWGLVLALDLERYDWRPGSRSLVRATEGTIAERIPPRKAVRAGAPIELPHIVVLVSDADRVLVEPLAARTETLPRLYDTDLMAGGGHVTGWAVSASDIENVTSAIETLAAGLDPADPLLFAMGDGNHSFATALSCWQDVRAGLTEAERALHPARFALVEVENIFDDGLEFEPIHRVLFGVQRGHVLASLRRVCAGVDLRDVDDSDGLHRALDLVANQSEGQRFAIVDAAGALVVTLTGAPAHLAVGTLTDVIDGLVDQRMAEVDYIHGAHVAAELGRRPGDLAVLLPPVAKETFFDAIRASGALPRKTFSLGHASDKRYYLEARSLT